MNEISFPECGLCDGMRICSCKSEPIDKRFIAACHAMQGFLTGVISHPDHNGDIPPLADLTRSSVLFADALIKVLEQR